MNANPGRNDLCSCGSGKKYKKCCMLTLVPSNNAQIVDVAWRELRQLEGMMLDQHLIPYATQDLPVDVITLAADDILPENLPDALDKELLFNNFFIPWFLFNWIPFENFGLQHFDAEITVSENYVKTHENQLSGKERRFIDKMNQSYYSFYSVLEVEIDKCLVVKDILLGTTHTLKERQGTHQLTPGDLIFSRILTFDNQSIFIGMAPFIIPTNFHNNLLEFKKWLVVENDDAPLSPNVLRNEFDKDLLDYFFDIMEMAFNKPLPTLVNTDGDLLQFATVHFKLTMAPEEALNRLLPLTLSKQPEEFLHGAKKNKSGKITAIELPWLKKGNKKHKSWDNTVLGHISIKAGKLILETNSEKRIHLGKKLLTKYLGEAISFQKTLIESPEQKMKGLPTSDDKQPLKLEDMPEEAQKQIKAMVTAHWASWFNNPIPALENKTPRQATKTMDGRERLEALLLQYERHDLEKGENLFKADISYLRKELSLE